MKDLNKKHEAIEIFLKEFCTEVYDMPFEDLELKMDNHRCVIWKDKEYFMPDDNSFYSEDDDLIWDFLNNNCHS